MINYKKKITKIKTELFLNEFPIIFLLQHNNFTIKDWFDFKQKLKEISGNNSKILNVKNSLLKKNFLIMNNFKNQCEKSEKFFDIFDTALKAKENEKFHFLCQGPNLIIGCKTETELQPIWSFINSQSKIVFISCIYKQQILNHLDLEILIKTNSSIYSHFLDILEKKNSLVCTLHQSLTITPLSLVKSNHIQILRCLEQSFQDKK